MPANVPTFTPLLALMEYLSNARRITMPYPIRPTIISTSTWLLNQSLVRGNFTIMMT